MQVGQRVAPGHAADGVVPLDQVWVDANFKERQLVDLRVGQAGDADRPTFTAARSFHGRVAGFGAGTGSAFALLPPQNATGNWIKVVQRLPVASRSIRPRSKHPLRLGLSMDADIELSK